MVSNPYDQLMSHHRFTNSIPLDIHHGNILLRLPKSLDSMSTKELYKEFGIPKLKPVVRFDEKPLPTGVPTHAIPRVWLGKNSNKIPLSEAEILLTDFGLSFQPSTTPRYHHQSYQGTLLPPEVYFLAQEPLDRKSVV